MTMEEAAENLLFSRDIIFYINDKIDKLPFNDERKDFIYKMIVDGLSSRKRMNKEKLKWLEEEIKKYKE